MSRSKSYLNTALRNVLVALCIWLVVPAPASAQTQGVRIIKTRKQGRRQSANLIPSAFTVQRGETLGMYAQWTGFSPHQLIIQAGIKNPTQFREGLELRLMLNPEQWMRVHAGRAMRPPQRSGFQPLKPLKPLTSADVPKPPPPAELQFLIHTVQSGENAGEIAQYYGLGLDVLQQANGETNFAAVLPGQNIYIPNFQGKAIPQQARILPASTTSKTKIRAPSPIVVPFRKGR